MATADPSPLQQSEPSNQPTSQKQKIQSQGLRKSFRAAAKRRVAVFWDLDNKPPRLEAYEVAMEVKMVAEAFGEVVEMVAYANRHVFKFIPMYEREARQNRKELDQLELEGVVKPEQPYLCKICRQTFAIHVELQNHILSFHEKGRQRVARLLGSEDLTAEQKESLEAKRRRYMEGSRKVVLPEVGYNLDYELERAGVVVGLVSDDPQAADTALKSCMWRTLEAEKVDCFVLVSDDTDYEDVLLAAGVKGLQRVVVAETIALKKSVDVWLSWFDLMAGGARIAAAEASKAYLSELRKKKKALEKKKVDQNVSKGSFQRVWRRDTSKRKEGKSLPQIEQVSSFSFSSKDSAQQVGPN
ncbi:hypothetical protein O6H91_Y236600 [Diphasiastrum complanatum]|nr:hypothetical protein O6H91_Y236600 [Diphasiastrum complanatum]